MIMYKGKKHIRQCYFEGRKRKRKKEIAVVHHNLIWPSFCQAYVYKLSLFIYKWMNSRVFLLLKILAKKKKIKTDSLWTKSPS